MKPSLINIGLLASLALIAYLVFQPVEQKPVTQQQMANISKAISNQFVREQSAQASQPVENKSVDPTSATNQQSILAVIYKKSNATWFFKAKDSQDRVDSISASFKNYFVDQLKFDADEQPILTHIPQSMHAANTSSMRVATFRIAGVEVTVSQLGGDQDVLANVQRWMRQIGLDDSSPIQLDFKDNKNTILVKMPR